MVYTRVCNIIVEYSADLSRKSLYIIFSIYYIICEPQGYNTKRGSLPRFPRSLIPGLRSAAKVERASGKSVLVCSEEPFYNIIHIYVLNTRIKYSRTRGG